MKLDEFFWDERYKSGVTPWDIGNISIPIKEYIDQLTDINIKILIPGCGNAYEANYLFEKDFKNVYVIDVANDPIKRFISANPDFPKNQIILGDFFDLSDEFDLIIEQTFFCALSPKLRIGYVQKMHELLKTHGKLVGVLFNVPLNSDQPPFGGNKQEYQQLFSEYFNKIVIEKCYNSIYPRMDREVFIIIEK